MQKKLSNTELNEYINEAVKDGRSWEVIDLMREGTIGLEEKKAIRDLATLHKRYDFVSFIDEGGLEEVKASVGVQMDDHVMTEETEVVGDSTVVKIDDKIIERIRDRNEFNQRVIEEFNKKIKRFVKNGTISEENRDAYLKEKNILDGLLKSKKDSCFSDVSLLIGFGNGIKYDARESNVLAQGLPADANAIMHAIYYGFTDIVSLILDKRKSLNSNFVARLNKEGDIESFLGEWIANGFVVYHGPDKAIKNDSHKSLLKYSDLINHYKGTKLGGLLQNTWRKEREDFFQIIPDLDQKKINIEEAREFIKYFINNRGFDVDFALNSVAGVGTLMMQAIKFKCPEIVELLLQYGSDPRKDIEFDVDGSGVIPRYTPLVLATIKDDIEAVNIILEYSGRLTTEITAAGNFTALMHAVREDSGHPEKNYAEELGVYKDSKIEIAKILLQHGARISYKNKRSNAAFDLITEKNKIFFIDLVIKNLRKENFIKHDGDDIKYIKETLAPYCKKGGDYIRYYQLEILAEEMLAKFPDALLEFKTTSKDLKSKLESAFSEDLKSKLESAFSDLKAEISAVKYPDPLVEAQMLLEESASGLGILHQNLLQLKKTRLERLYADIESIITVEKPEGKRVTFADRSTTVIIPDAIGSEVRSSKKESKSRTASVYSVGGISSAATGQLDLEDEDMMKRILTEELDSDNPLPTNVVGISLDRALRRNAVSYPLKGALKKPITTEPRTVVIEAAAGAGSDVSIRKR